MLAIWAFGTSFHAPEIDIERKEEWKSLPLESVSKKGRVIYRSLRRGTKTTIVSVRHKTKESGVKSKNNGI